MIDLRLGDVSEVEFVRSIDGEWTQFQSNVTALAQHAAAGHNIPPVQVAAMVSKMLDVLGQAWSDLRCKLCAMATMSKCLSEVAQQRQLLKSRTSGKLVRTQTAVQVGTAAACCDNFSKVIQSAAVRTEAMERIWSQVNTVVAASIDDSKSKLVEAKAAIDTIEKEIEVSKQQQEGCTQAKAGLSPSTLKGVTNFLLTDHEKPLTRGQIKIHRELYDHDLSFNRLEVARDEIFFQTQKRQIKTASMHDPAQQEAALKALETLARIANENAEKPTQAIKCLHPRTPQLSGTHPRTPQLSGVSSTSVDDHSVTPKAVCASPQNDTSDISTVEEPEGHVQIDHGTMSESSPIIKMPQKTADAMQNVWPVRPKWLQPRSPPERRFPYDSSWYNYEQQALWQALVHDEISKGQGTFRPEDFPHTTKPFKHGTTHGQVKPCLGMNVDLIQDLWLCEDDQHAAERVALHLRAGANPNTLHTMQGDSKVQGGWITEESALHIASARGLTKVVQMLLHAQADVELRNHNGDTALGIASYMKHADCVAELLAAGSIPNASGSDASPLLLAATSGASDCLQVMVSCCTTSLICVQLLLDSGAEPSYGDQNGWSPLHAANMKANCVRTGNKLVFVHARSV